MTDRPMIFSPEMVRALGDGRKTQTRRMLKPQPPVGHQLVGIYAPAPGLTAVFNPVGRDNRFDADQDVTVRLPSISKRIWVKEAVAVWQGKHADIVYRADATDENWDDLMHDANDGAPWAVYSRMYMPKRFSRFTLVVTDVRVQRVQDITEADARAEGAWPVLLDPNEMGLAGDGSYRDGFRDLWNRIHGTGAWDRNDWVAALTFDVHRRNILEMDG